MKFLQRKNRYELHPDKITIDVLRKYDSEIQASRFIEFFLYFPEKEAAKIAARKIRDDNFKVYIDGPNFDGKWLCLATTMMVPSTINLIRSRLYFERICTELNGIYDGWETEIK
jgi:hypothetical protein